ncbi:MAG: bifunctional (p)ppGpp synthetase/guanosine-3',5'-bis(diphosphate) 3'-pyrophosphohydrolase [Holophagales bacterium]|jgi:GTP pyrophosphokinase|nr:bifunctional (p)ppGpp synthetase/guanosine-3',5'-bis(diphosphate) 3'-pyrophosphohydrolase [Holophagales bacterium]
MEEELFNLSARIREGENPFEDNCSCSTLEGAYQQVLNKFLQFHPDGDRKVLDAAFELARSAHALQCRKSGEPYFFHPLAVAKSLAEWNLDYVSLVCGILHDVAEDTSITNEEITKQFGAEVGGIVDGLTKISKLESQDRAWLNAENIRKFLVAIGKDVRVLLVKLADRLHNMRTIGSMREEKRRRIAHETMELYAPLANRFGMGHVRMELEDLAFEVLEPDSHDALCDALQTKIQNHGAQIKDILLTLENLLVANGIKAEVLGRLKSLHAVWRKMGIQKKELDGIFDWLVYRVICPDRTSCYMALGIVHALYKPIPGRFKDYISLPKDNGYQSIHTSVLMPTGDSFEVQIRTKEMHEHAETGIISHWTYKEGRIANRQELDQIVFLRQMAELNQYAHDSQDLVINLKGELVSNQIQVFTPKGELKSLPVGSTPVDFAYSIHSEIGHHCVGAKVNGRIVQLRHQLESGDRIEIMTRIDRKPTRDWLTFVKSASARSRIQSFIREEERRHAIEIGKDRLLRDSHAFDLSLDQPEYQGILELRLKELKMIDWDAFYAAVGFNRISTLRLLEPILQDETHKNEENGLVTNGSDTILVDENVGIVFSLARCCKPIWGDDIVGYTTRGRGISIHRAICPHLNSKAMPTERRISVAWGKQGRTVFETEIVVTSVDQSGLVAAISSVLQQVGISIQHFNASTTNDGVATIHIALHVKDRNHLVDIMGHIRHVKGINSVERVRGTFLSHHRPHGNLTNS